MRRSPRFLLLAVFVTAGAARAEAAPELAGSAAEDPAPAALATPSISAGVGSGQPVFNGNNQLNFPFDFVTPANNHSAAFVDVSIGI